GKAPFWPKRMRSTVIRLADSRTELRAHGLLRSKHSQRAPRSCGMNGLEIEAFSKRYRRGVRALDDVSLTIGPGVLGLLGPNGAGKSTLMRILSTVLRPTSGSVSWNGVDVLRNPDALRSQLGYLPQDCGVYPNLSAREFLRYVATLKGMGANAAERRIGELIDQLNLGA